MTDNDLSVLPFVGESVPVGGDSSEVKHLVFVYPLQRLSGETLSCSVGPYNAGTGQSLAEV